MGVFLSKAAVCQGRLQTSRLYIRQDKHFICSNAYEGMLALIVRLMFFQVMSRAVSSESDTRIALKGQAF